MSINYFFAFVLAFLGGMYFYFSPNYTQSSNAEEVPQIELSRFSLYEISPKGIDHLLEGEEGKKFAEYYVVTSAKFSDNTKKMLHTLRADRADYRYNSLKIEGNVRYLREDGLECRSEEALYRTQEGLVEIPKGFTMTQGAHQIRGESLLYNVDEKSLSAQRVSGSYQLN